VLSTYPFKLPERFSVELRSEEFPGHSKQAALVSDKNFFTLLDAWHEVKFC
jgi:hypothetical protein